MEIVTQLQNKKSKCPAPLGHFRFRCPLIQTSNAFPFSATCNHPQVLSWEYAVYRSARVPG